MNKDEWLRLQEQWRQSGNVQLNNSQLPQGQQVLYSPPVGQPNGRFYDNTGRQVGQPANSPHMAHLSPVQSYQGLPGVPGYTVGPPPQGVIGSPGYPGQPGQQGMPGVPGRMPPASLPAMGNPSGKRKVLYWVLVGTALLSAVLFVGVLVIYLLK